METLLLLSVFIGFFFTFLILPKWIEKSKKIGLLWEDMNKPGHPKNVAASGGIVAVMSFVLGVLFYIAMRTFYVKDSGVTLQIFSILSVILIYSLIGLVDDLFGWRRGGLSRRFRLILAFFGAIPLVVINAGNSMINFPMLGNVELGLLYPLFLVPLGIAGATTTYNFLAGYNGLETSQGIIILSFLSFVAYSTGSPWLALVGMIMVASLFGFYIFNKYPAKVFPGDSLTWSIGALIAIMAILGNFEKIAVFIFIPYILETILKLRGGLKKQSFAKVHANKSLEMPYEKIYGLEHLAIYLLKQIKKDRKVYEKEVVYLINGFQIGIIILGYFLFM